MQRKTHRVDARVISVGNITAGGTGKTPTVLHQIAALARENEDRIGVLTRGYGSAKTSEPLLSSRLTEEEYVEQLGDEPALILQKHPEVLVVKGRDRVACAQIAVSAGQCTVLILADGFQYVRLHRDENVLVIDATNPFGNGQLIPRGILREPMEAIARATAVVLSRCDQATDLGALENTIRSYSNVPLERTRHTPTVYVQARSGREEPLETFHGTDVILASGIGNPDAFRATVASTGCNVVECRVRRDHAALTQEDLRAELPIVITEKDAVKLRNAPENVYALRIELQPYD